MDPSGLNSFPTGLIHSQGTGALPSPSSVPKTKITTQTLGCFISLNTLQILEHVVVCMLIFSSNLYLLPSLPVGQHTTTPSLSSKIHGSMEASSMEFCQHEELLDCTLMVDLNATLVTTMPNLYTTIKPDIYTCHLKAKLSLGFIALFNCKAFYMYSCLHSSTS